MLRIVSPSTGTKSDQDVSSAHRMPSAFQESVMMTLVTIVAISRRGGKWSSLCTELSTKITQVLAVLKNVCLSHSSSNVRYTGEDKYLICTIIAFSCIL